MNFVQTKKKQKVGIWVWAAKAFSKQYSCFGLALLVVLPSSVLLAVLYPTYAPLLLFRVFYQDLLWQQYFSTIICWIIVPVFWTVSAVMAILAVKQYIHRRNGDSVVILKEAFSSLAWVIVAVWKIVLALWFFLFFVSQVTWYLRTYKLWTIMLQPIVQLLGVAFLCEFIRQHSFGLTVFTLYGGDFKEALARSKAVVKHNIWSVRLYDLLFLTLLALLPCLLLIYGWLVDEFIESLLFSPIIKIVVITSMHIFFLFMMVARTFFFIKLEELQELKTKTAIEL